MANECNAEKCSQDPLPPFATFAERRERVPRPPARAPPAATRPGGKPPRPTWVDPEEVYPSARLEKGAPIPLDRPKLGPSPAMDSPQESTLPHHAVPSAYQRDTRRGPPHVRAVNRPDPPWVDPEGVYPDRVRPEKGAPVPPDRPKLGPAGKRYTVPHPKPVRMGDPAA